MSFAQRCLFSSFFRKWQYAVDALRDPDPFEADIVLDPHDVKVPPFLFSFVLGCFVRERRQYNGSKTRLWKM